MQPSSLSLNGANCGQEALLARSRIDANSVKVNPWETRVRQRNKNICRILLPPIIALVISLLLVVAGIILLILCYYGGSGMNLKPMCDFESASHGWITALAISLIAVGILGPAFSVGLYIFCKRKRRTKHATNNSFYADALLEEMISGTSLEDHYDIQGQNGSETIVFIAGVGCPRSFSKFYTESLNQTYRTIAAELPGNGTLSAVPFSTRRSIRVLKRIIDREVKKNDKIVLVSYGIGGMVALALLERYPDLFSGMMLLGDLGHSRRHHCGRSVFLLRSLRWVCDFQNTTFQRRVQKYNANEKVKQLVDQDDFTSSSIYRWFCDDRLPISSYKDVIRLPTLALCGNLHLVKSFKQQLPNLRTKAQEGASGMVIPNVSFDFGECNDTIAEFASEVFSKSLPRENVTESPFLMGNAQL